MHELSIVMGIVELAEKEAEKAGASRVDEINLEIGTMAGIEFDAFDFVWPLGIKDSILQNAKRNIKKIRAKAVCLECKTEFFAKRVFDNCPECGNLFTEIIEGRELRVSSLVVT